MSIFKNIYFFVQFKWTLNKIKVKLLMRGEKKNKKQETRKVGWNLYAYVMPF